MATQIIQSQNFPIVSVLNGHAVTTSIDVAAFFGKLHKNVLRSIDSVLASCPDSAKLNFELCYEYNKLQNGKPLKYYQLTRDAFVFVVMGFTGEKATAFKWAYIEAFNRMEAQLRAQSLPPATITPAQQLELRKAIAKRAKVDGAAYQKIYHALYDRFQIAKYDQLKATDFSDALAFVNTCGLSEIPGRKPLVFSAIEAENLQGALYHLRYVHRDSFVAFYKFLVATRSPLASQVYEALNDLHLRGVERVMERQGYGYKDLEAI